MKLFRNRYLVIIDGALLCALVFSLYAVRLESWDFGPSHERRAVAFALTAIPLQLLVCRAFGLYQRLWRFASVAELKRIFVACAASALPVYLLGRFGLPAAHVTDGPVPLSVLLPYALISVGIVGAPRLVIRIGGWRAARKRSTADKRVLIVGAGAAGEMIARELDRNRELRMVPIGFVDDDPLKQGMTLGGVPILGPLSGISATIRRYGADEVIIAIPTAPGAVIRSVVRAARDARVRTRIVPGLFEILAERVSVTAIREVQIEDLLRRAPVETDLRAVSSLATGPTVLVTGAGGSIGSELCRQLHSLKPARLILLGHGENSVFAVQQELTRLGGVEIIPVIADVRTAWKIRDVFARFRPHAVFHAAAHKHVPLMESDPTEAVTNNILGTRVVVDAAVEFGATHFVLISSDKAVRPTNVMGATKRVAEEIVRNAARKHDVNFVVVRFGNVLGSRGSVVPIFAEQIKAGGPVTVTHPEMRRYFMTIPEAVQLVLQAGAMGKGGELFMLDMGEPVKVVDLARDMIRLSGLEEGLDIEIEFTGIRPGEKLYEEMFFSHEVTSPTRHPKILCAREAYERGGRADERAVEGLIQVAKYGTGGAGNAGAEIRSRLRQLVPDYTPWGAGDDVVPISARKERGDAQPRWDREVPLRGPASAADRAVEGLN